MRRLALIVAAAVLIGCLPAEAPKKTADAASAAPAALTCTQEITKTAALTGADANDLITVRSFAAPAIPEVFKGEDTTENGALCTNATVIMTVHSGQSSAPLIVVSSPAVALDMVTGATAPFNPTALKALLEKFAAVEVTTQDKAPAFGTVTVATGLSREDYNALKATRAPMVCVMETVHNRVCYAMVGAAPYTRADSFFVEDVS
jgi:hypothetical protein